uniref:Uncharacterized protein n=1 Tax=Romanomermis culicivorax TaxID=13658 RepID=A0A915KUN7_ROMCU
MCTIRLQIFLILALSRSSLSLEIIRGFIDDYTKCAIATGTLNCSSNSSYHSDAEVFLMDDDGVGNYDDRMGWATSDEKGNFEVQGCGYDFLSDPDPYVKIFTFCNAPRGKFIKTRVVQKFSPEKIEYVLIKFSKSS